jgi:hypothetical protein
MPLNTLGIVYAQAESRRLELPEQDTLELTLIGAMLQGTIGMVAVSEVARQRREAAIAAAPPTVPPAPPAPQTPPRLAGTPPESATVGEAYRFAVDVQGHPRPGVTLDGGTLPHGLQLSSSGVLEGTPRTAGPFEFVVRAANGVGSDALRSVSITVEPPPTPPTIQAKLPSSGTVGTAYTGSLVVSGAPTPTLSVLSGELPEGLEIDARGPSLRGTPKTEGTFEFAIRAENAGGVADTPTVRVTIRPAGRPSAAGSPA